MLVLLLVIYRAPLLTLDPLLAVGIAIQLTSAVGAAMADAGVWLNSQAGSIMIVLLLALAPTTACLSPALPRGAGRHPNRWAATATAMRRVGQAIASSAATVILVLLILLLVTLLLHPAGPGHLRPFLTTGVAVMLVAALTSVPALMPAGPCRVLAVAGRPRWAGGRLAPATQVRDS